MPFSIKMTIHIFKEWYKTCICQSDWYVVMEHFRISQMHKFVHCLHKFIAKFVHRLHKLVFCWNTHLLLFQRDLHKFFKELLP